MIILLDETELSMNQNSMASNTNVSSSEYEILDLSEADKIAAQKYLSDNGVRGLENFLAERLEAWRKWFHFCFEKTFISFVSYLRF